MHNLLPFGGEAYLYPSFLSRETAQAHFDEFSSGIPWQQDELIMFGRQIQTARKVAWFGDQSFSYTYSNTTKRALLWTPALLTLKEQVQSFTAQSFNYCLLNLYDSGLEGMGWHADNKPELLQDGAIASVSLGAERPFIFKHRGTGEKVKVDLPPGSLLLMTGTTQSNWLHALPKRKRIATPRINLTFRTIVT